MTDSKVKNTLLTPNSTKPFDHRFPFKKPFVSNTPKFTTVFRTQNRGGK